MKLKKILATVMATIAAVATFGFAGCGSSKGKDVKVMKDIYLTAEDYAFAIAKENTTLLEEVNAMLDNWTKDGSLDTLINSYFDGNADFTYENKSSSPKDGDFIMATNAAFPPFEYKKGAYFCGVDIEIAYNIAQELGKTLFVYDMEFDSIISSVKTGESDIGMAGMTVTDERLEQVDFATPYYKSAQVLTVKVGNTKFDSCTTAEQVENILKAQSKSFKIGTQTGTTGYMYSAGDEDFGYDGFKNLTTKSYQTGALAMTDLDNGRIDAVILDLQPSLMIAQSINAK